METGIFAVKHKSDEVRMKSASGGAFTALSDAVLKMKGSVYGAVMNESGRVAHIRAEDSEMRDRQCGSKYAQSNMQGIYIQVIEDLRQEKTVFFTGTPCQIAGLNKYMKMHELPGLITCDIVCHGVMNPQILKDFYEYISKKHGKVKEICFRDKNKGWKEQKWALYYADKKTNTGIIKRLKRIYMRNYSLQEACFSCLYANQNRVSDITIGDYWGIGKLDKSFEDSLGISMVWIHTEKGSKLFDSIRDKVWSIQGAWDNCVQPQLTEPTKRPKNYEAFWELYRAKGIKPVLNKYGGPEALRKILAKLK